MKFVGLDLGGVNSLACIHEAEGMEKIQASAFPQRPSVVLFPLIRKERLLSGDEALQNERGSGLCWPPLASAASSGWSHGLPPCDGGRVLLATVWQCLVEGGRWSEPQWQPPDGLPPMNRPTPADCLIGEAKSVLARALGGENHVSVVLAIPNQLPEESQDALITRLPSGVRLVWRSVAAAMAWAENNIENIGPETQLVVLDVGLCSVEISGPRMRPVRRLSWFP